MMTSRWSGEDTGGEDDAPGGLGGGRGPLGEDIGRIKARLDHLLPLVDKVERAAAGLHELDKGLLDTRNSIARLDEKLDRLATDLKAHGERLAGDIKSQGERLGADLKSQADKFAGLEAKVDSLRFWTARIVGGAAVLGFLVWLITMWREPIGRALLGQ